MADFFSFLDGNVWVVILIIAVAFVGVIGFFALLLVPLVAALFSSGDEDAGVLTVEDRQRGYEMLSYPAKQRTHSVSPSVQLSIVKLNGELPGGLRLEAGSELSKAEHFELNEFDVGDPAFDDAFAKSAHNYEEAVAALSRPNVAAGRQPALHRHVPRPLHAMRIALYPLGGCCA